MREDDPDMPLRAFDFVIEKYPDDPDMPWRALDLFIEFSRKERFLSLGKIERLLEDLDLPELFGSLVATESRPDPDFLFKAFDYLCNKCPNNSDPFNYMIEAPDYESTDVDDDDWLQEQCHPMLDIFSIRYLDTDNLEPEKQLGRIYMSTSAGTFDIYNVDKIDKTRETIKHGDEFDIMDFQGPIPFHEGSDRLNFDLFCGTYKGSVDDLFGDVKFYSRCNPTLEKISLDRIDGTGKIIVFMGLYPHATVAQVEVSLNTSVAFNLYGTISAFSDEICDPGASSILFLNEKKRKIIVGTDGLIPLSRSRVAVPVGSELYLDFSLVVDGKLLEKTMRFSALKGGKLKKTFQRLSVTVHWDAFYYQSQQGGE